MSNVNRLALLGGRPLNPEPFPEYNTIGKEERKEVLKVLETGHLSDFVASPDDFFWGGKMVRKLEDAFKDFFQVPYAVAVNSATSGLYCALMAMDIGPGDEVIVPPYTMSATATTVLMTGAIPIFGDVEDKTFCLDPNSVRALVSPNTKGIVAVNLFGHPALLEDLQTIAKEMGLFLLEDNAQAPRAKCMGRYTGTFGQAGVFSFNRHKTMQCGEGGVIITSDEEVARKCAMVRNHGECVVGPWQESDIVNTMGGNYRMTEMEAAVANCQFHKLEELTRSRVELAEYLTKNLQGIEGITPPAVRDGCTHVYYFYVMKYDQAKTGIPRELFSRAVCEEGVLLRAGYVEPLYRLPLFQKKICLGKGGYPFTLNPRSHELQYGPEMCPTVERLQEKEIILTNITYPPLGAKEMGIFVSAIEKVLENKDQLKKIGYLDSF